MIASMQLIPRWKIWEGTPIFTNILQHANYIYGIAKLFQYH